MAHTRFECIRCGRLIASCGGESMLYDHICIGVMPKVGLIFLHGPLSWPWGSIFDSKYAHTGAPR